MKTLLFISLFFLSIVVFAATDQYLFCPVYNFDASSRFGGDSIYNPYAESGGKYLVKCNFHAHARCWEGLTYGHGTGEDIQRVYSQLHYGVHAVSDYQYIDTSEQFSPNYMACYEHGFNLLKTHQLIVGAEKVCWKDYPLPQSASNKQDILNRLSSSSKNALIILNHPMLRNGYSSADVKQLSGYHCMEVLNPAAISTKLWDAALSAGNPVFIAGDDDVHNVLDTNKTGNICTWVFVNRVNRREVIQAMKMGNSYGMIIGKTLSEEVRHQHNNSMPLLHSVSVLNDIIKVQFTKPAKAIRVTGENGHLMDSRSSANCASFPFPKSEPYARVVADFGDGTQIYLNPVFRYAKNPLQQVAATINTSQTLIRQLAGMLVLVCWSLLLLRFLFPHLYRRLSFQINQYKYGRISDARFLENVAVRNRRVVRFVHRFFDNLGMQGKNETE